MRVASDLHRWTIAKVGRQDRQAGVQPEHELERVLAVGGLGGHVKGRVVINHGPKAGPNEHLGIGDQHARRRGRCLA